MYEKFLVSYSLMDFISFYLDFQFISLIFYFKRRHATKLLICSNTPIKFMRKWVTSDRRLTIHSLLYLKHVGCFNLFSIVNFLYMIRFCNCFFTTLTKKRLIPCFSNRKDQCLEQGWSIYKIMNLNLIYFLFIILLLRLNTIS